MRTAKLIRVALMATAALAALVGAASGRNLSFSNQNFRVTYSSLEFVSYVTVRCSLTLEGSLHAKTIAKVLNSLIGYITRATFRRPCTNGTAWFHSGETNEALGGTFSNRLPWQIRYGGFTTNLPNISSIRLVLPSMLFTIRTPFISVPILCEFQTTNVNGNAIGDADREVGGGLTTLAPSGTIASSSGGCPQGRLGAPSDDGRIVVLSTTTTRITVTLI